MLCFSCICGVGRKSVMLRLVAEKMRRFLIVLPG